MDIFLAIVAVIAIVVFLSILEEHLSRVGEVGEELAESIRERLVIRMIAVLITVGIIVVFSEATGVNMATELFATLAGAIGISIATVVQNELEMLDVL